MTSPELYTKDARVWLPDEAEVWKSAELIRDYSPGDLTLSLRLDDGTVVEHQIDGRSDGRSGGLPPLRNPNVLEGLNDLTALSYLHEPALLHNLKVRFTDSRLIYTYCGIVLVAINPYESLPIYGADIISAYHGQDAREMDPHIFAVAEEAYKQMARDGRNQSIVVSGDSGAGKTISAKYAMRYFATVSCSTGETSIEERVLASNPIMEAFGNAKTIRNDNSSRFGKYIEILFDRRRRIIGAHIRTYLLEKSRVVFQACGERNYHIFYQLCASSHLPEFKAFRLGCVDDFHCANQGQSPLLNRVDDAKELCKSRRALALLGMSEREQVAVFQTLAAILHLCNVQVKPQSEDQSRISPDDEHLVAFCELMRVPCEEMAHWLCHTKLKTTVDTYVKSVSALSAVSGRDALAKHVYARLFGWIVDRINGALRSAANQHSFIGVLDIYGFEVFQINSFEQFCINYANEVLQQQFNLHVFKLDQEEYTKEGIPWTMIDFCDNQPVINLIEAKLGILDLLDEECRMPKGSDDSWAQKMYNTLLKKHALFKKPKLSNRAFIVHHFGDEVEYQCEGFLEKNKDRVNEEQINVLKSSKFDLLLKLFEEDEEASSSSQQHTAGTRRSHPGRRDVKTVGCQFRHSLHLLMDILNATSPHYVRCIKPNDHKASFVLEPLKVTQQLRACGILETIRISAAGFPSRWSYQEFFCRYRVLLKQRDVLPDRVQTCKNLTNKLIKDQDKFQFGKTKIFFRAGQVAYLEKLRSDQLRSACVSIQKNVRGWLALTKYQRMRRSALTVQRWLRGHRARCYVAFLKRSRAAVVIQKNVRMWAAKRSYQRRRSAAVTLQSFLRAHVARKKYHQMVLEQKAEIIQKWARGWLERRRYRRALRAAVLLQCCMRRWRAKKELKALKREARSVEHLQKLNNGMENKIIQLQRKINEQHQEMRELRKLLCLAEALLSSEREAHHRTTLGFQQEARDQDQKIGSLSEQLLLLQQELDRSLRDKADLEEQMKVYKEETQLVIEELNMRNSLLKAEKAVLASGILQSDGNPPLTWIKLTVEGTKQMDNILTGESSGFQSADLHLEEQPDPTEDTNLTSSGQSGPKRRDSGRSSRSSSQFSLNLGSSEGESASVRSEDEGQPSEELPVLLKLQRKVKELEQNKQSLWERLDHKEGARQAKACSSKKELAEQITAGRAELDLEKLKRHDLESENKKLKRDLNDLRKSLSSENSHLMPPAPGSLPYNLLLDQLNSSNEELEMRKEEVLLLHSHMVRQDALKHRDLNVAHLCSMCTSALCAPLQDSTFGEGVRLGLEVPSVPEVHRSTTLRTLNEDGELWLAYDGLKETNRLLECQMQQQKRAHMEECNQLLEEVQRLREEREEQRNLLAQSLVLSEDARIEACLNHEIRRLARENLELVEQREAQDKAIRKLKKQLEDYAKKVEEYETTARQKYNASLSAPRGSEVNIARKERECRGMLEYRVADVSRLLRNVVTELKPPGAADGSIPGLPAYIIFMCVRYADCVNDEQRVSSLLNSAISSIKGVVKKRGKEFRVLSFWLANTCRLRHCLRQYSGDEAVSQHNTAKQNQQCLTNFELSEYQEVLGDLIEQIYHQLIKCTEAVLQPLIVASVLNPETTQAVLGSKLMGQRKRSWGLPEEEAITVEALLQHLDNFYTTMSLHGVDPHLIRQVVKQLYHIICSVSFNHLLLRKDMCSWSTGLQIRYNSWQLQDWLMDRELADCGAKETLEPLKQAALLLQVNKKTEADAAAIGGLCTAISPTQIVKILSLYTPASEFEERVSPAFIAAVKNTLNHRADCPTLLMDVKKIFPLSLVFTPSAVALETIQIPASLNLGFLTRI
uniref:Myosin VAb n=1 Tax=Tetraodon nigroviridis TaxID=99883 RepID=H3D867_TETNG